ncbi:MAG: hypothetical protein JNL67_10810 [Planctomycetaceae bacterium]|nr:hypothetical protein [Planctomycetaceae bacterium]
MKRLLHHFSRTIAALALAAVAATLAASPATAQLSALKGAPKPIDAVVPPAVDSAPTVSPLVGAWQGVFEGPQQRMTFQMMVFPDGTYKARIVTEESAPSEPTVAMFSGKWSIEGQKLVLVNSADGSVEKTDIELQGDDLIMKAIGPNGSNMNMRRVPLPTPSVPNDANGPRPIASEPAGFGPRGPSNPNSTGPNPTRQPTGPVGPAPAPVVGTWYGSGIVAGSQMDCMVQIQPNGTYQSQINVRNGSVASQISEQGTWKLRGRKIVFETEEEATYIPYKVEDGVLILDYSEDVGIVAVLSPTPGQGQIQVVGGGYDD